MAFTINDSVLEQYTEESGVTNVVIPEGVTEIKPSAFHGSNVTSVYIPDGVRTIEGGTFSDCKQLHTVRLPRQLESTATAFTFEEKRKKGQKEYQEKAWVRERL